MNRPVTHDHLLSVRVPIALASHAKEVAKTQGMNLSTFVRQSMKRNIDLYVLHEHDLLLMGND